jgi:hypothetical protein
MVLHFPVRRQAGRQPPSAATRMRSPCSASPPGAISVGVLQSMPSAQGLFRRGILQAVWHTTSSPPWAQPNDDS